MQSGQARQMSYELFQELADDLCEPLDEGLTLDVRLELYQSKLIYLRNVYEQAFRERNGSGTTRFTDEDLVRIRDSAEVTSSFLHTAMIEKVKDSMRTLSDRVERRG